MRQFGGATKYLRLLIRLKGRIPQSEKELRRSLGKQEEKRTRDYALFIER
jgi:hypothetical protein